jgi:hypothetical protein
MGSVLSLTTEKDRVFTVFENDQVLTATQLNDLFSYLDVQDRLSRVKTLGSGIICGLSLTRKGNTVLLGSGAAITTEGHLLFFDRDITFNAYVAWKDENAKYAPLEGIEPVYQLLEKVQDQRDAVSLGDFSPREGAGPDRFVGLLYLEEYLYDPDLCTGLDCDNKGARVVRDQRVLLVPEDRANELLSGSRSRKIPDLQDVFVPRVLLHSGITSGNNLDAALRSPFAARKDIMTTLSGIYKYCSDFLGDIFKDDPVGDWSARVENHFSDKALHNRQHLYNFLCDLADACNELVQTIPHEKSFCTPPLSFPRHILLGGMAEKAVIPERFETARATPEHRHPFYASPLVNAGDDNIQKIRFMFMRIHAMISCFHFPGNGNIKITPDFSGNCRLGKRAIPYYYKYDAKLPINLYWDYEANAGNRENQLLYYHSDKYPVKNDRVSDPLKFRIHENDFFRIEGFAGMDFADAETRIEKIITGNNLPVRLISLQLERDTSAVIPRKWKFPYLQVNDHFLKQSLKDHLNQSVRIQDDLIKNYAQVKPEDPPAATMNSIFNNFKSRKQEVENELNKGMLIDHLQSVKPVFNATISAATDVRVNTSTFSFCGTALPHDFLINTDVISKAGLLKDLLDRKIESKKEELILGNFIKKNPGMESAAGVSRGGTFVLAYTASDKKVVAGFMLPYSYVDHDILEEVPEQAPQPPVFPPKIDIGKLFLPKPPYVNLVETRFKDLDFKIADTNKLLDQKANMSVLETINANQNQVFSNVINTLSGISTQFKDAYQNINLNQNQLIGSVVNAFTGITANLPIKKDPVIVDFIPYPEYRDDLKFYTEETDPGRKKELAKKIGDNLKAELGSRSFDIRNPEDVNIIREVTNTANLLPDDISKNLRKFIQNKITL